MAIEDEVHRCDFCGCREKRWENLPLCGWLCRCCGAYWLQDETWRGNGCGSSRMTDAVSRKWAAEQECWKLDEQLKTLRKMRREANKRLGQALKDIYELSTKVVRQ